MLRVCCTTFWKWDWERKYGNYNVTVHTPDTWNLIFIIINSSVLMCRHLSGLPRSQWHNGPVASLGSDQCLWRHHHSPNYPNWSCLHMLQIFLVWLAPSSTVWSLLFYFVTGSPPLLPHQAEKQELDIPELGQILIGTSITFYGFCNKQYCLVSNIYVRTRFFVLNCTLKNCCNWH